VDQDRVWRCTATARAALAELLRELEPAEWEHPSLCAGWTVRHVAAHVISSPQAGTRDVLRAVVRARGRFDRAMDQEARRWAARPVERILADYAEHGGSRRHPPGTSYRDPLVDVLVHTQDIAIPLGRRVPTDPAAAALAAERVWTMSFPFRARSRFAGLRFVATDTEWSAGHGSPVTGPIEAILLTLTGRRAAVDRLSGEGAARV
jgi:uncharacterized protein (TIGR03083 family)